MSPADCCLPAPPIYPHPLTPTMTRWETQSQGQPCLLLFLAGSSCSQLIKDLCLHDTRTPYGLTLSPMQYSPFLHPPSSCNSRQLLSSLPTTILATSRLMFLPSLYSRSRAPCTHCTRQPWLLAPLDLDRALVNSRCIITKLPLAHNLPHTQRMAMSHLRQSLSQRPHLGYTLKNFNQVCRNLNLQ